MSSLPASFTYPFDPTGLAISNKIPGEQHIVTAVNYKDYHFIIPRWAPFFADGLQLRFVDTAGNARELVEGLDYYLGFRFATASRACAKPIFGGISFLDNTLNGVVVIDQYQTVGGEWTLDLQAITELLADRLHNPRLTRWEEVIDQPVYFPSIGHDWRVEDMVGMSDVVQSIVGIEAAIRDAAGDGASSHAQNYNNPHATTAAQVGAYSKAEIDTLLSAISTGGAANDTLKFVGLTGDEYKAWVLEGTAYDSARLNGMTYTTLFNAVRANIPASNIAGAYTALQLDDMLLGKLGTSERAADSSRLNGMLYNELWQEVRRDIPVANVVGALSEEALDGVVASKLDATATAADTARFDGKFPTEFKAWVLEGTSADTDLFEGLTLLEVQDQITSHANGIIFDDAVANPRARQVTYPAVASEPEVTNVWTKIATVSAPDYGLNLIGDARFLVTGGESIVSASGGTSYLVQVNSRGLSDFALSVQNLTGVSPFEAQFGMVLVETVVETVSTWTAEIWLKTTLSPAEITVTEFSQGTSELVSTPVQVIAEPVGIVYTVEGQAALQSTLSALATDVSTNYVGNVKFWEEIGKLAPHAYVAEQLGLVYTYVDALETELNATLENVLVEMTGAFDSLVTPP